MDLISSDLDRFYLIFYFSSKICLPPDITLLHQPKNTNITTTVPNWLALNSSGSLTSSFTISSLSTSTSESVSSDSDSVPSTMDTVLFDLLDSAVPHSAPKSISLRTTQPMPSTLSSIIQTLSETLKACLPRRVQEPTGPFMVLFDMLLSVFIAHGACKTDIQNLPIQVIGHSNPRYSVPVPVSEGDKCAICLGPYEEGDTVRHLACSHAFHTECVDAWLEKKSLCPICKTDAC